MFLTNGAGDTTTSVESAKRNGPQRNIQDLKIRNVKSAILKYPKINQHFYNKIMFDPTTDKLLYRCVRCGRKNLLKCNRKKDGSLIPQGKCKCGCKKFE